MASNVTSRKTVRDAVAALLSTALVGVGLPANIVYAYKKADFGKRSPVVCVTSAGSERVKNAQPVVTQSVFYIDVNVFVVMTATSWTENDSEDRIDLIEKMITDVIEDNNSNSTWAWMDVNGRSQIEPILLGGDEYQHELIQLKVTLYNA